MQYFYKFAKLVIHCSNCFSLQCTVVERLLAFNKQRSTCEQDRYLEFELTASERPRLTPEGVFQLQRQLDEHGIFSITVDQRWDLYRHWHLNYVRYLEKQIDASREEYRYTTIAI